MRYGDSLGADIRQEGPVPVYGSNGPVGTHAVANTRGPVIVVGRKGSHGKLQWSSSPVFAIDTTYYVDSSCTSADLRWLYFALQTTRLETLSQDVGVPGLSREQAYARRIPLPPLPIQRAIADFLDGETARIDALIVKKRSLVDLLQERWIETVRELVTGNVRFNDPLQVNQKEVAWDTANIVKLSQFLRFGSGTKPPSADESMYGGPIPWVLTGDLKDSNLRKTSRTVTEKAVREFGPLVVHPPKSLVIAMYGATIGKLAILDIPACVNQACSVLTPRGEDTVEFVFYWLLAHRKQLVERGYGAGQPNISQELLKGLRIALPKVSTQNAIVHRLSQHRACVSETKRKLHQQLKLLSEHRQALITAAVTGQLEIPGVAA